MSKVAFIGLGVMGYPMAAHLVQRGGHEVAIYNRTRATAEGWLREIRASDSGGQSSVEVADAPNFMARTRLALTPAEAADGADFVFCCVGADADLRQVTLGPDGAFGAMKTGSVFVDHTTASAEVARELAEVARNGGFGFLDAPVSGGQAGAEAGALTIMCGGDEDAYEKARPVMSAYGAKIGLLGPSGAGQLTKMVNQICIAGVLQGLAEGIHFAHRADLDVAKVMEAISAGAAGSWQMANRAETMDAGEYDFGFAVDWMRKDLGLVLTEANRNGASLPVAALVDQFYKEIQRAGGGRLDTSSLLKRLE